MEIDITRSGSVSVSEDLVGWRDHDQFVPLEVCRVRCPCCLSEVSRGGWILVLGMLSE